MIPRSDDTPRRTPAAPRAAGAPLASDDAMQPFSTPTHPSPHTAPAAAASVAVETAAQAASLALCIAQRAFAALIEQRSRAGEFRAAQMRSTASRTLSVMSADDRARLADWLSLQIATLPVHDADAVVGMLGRVDAWLAARIRRELPYVIAALAPRAGSGRVVAA
jgi:hypothetical protein